MTGRTDQTLGTVLSGSGISPGIASGTAVLVDSEDVQVEHQHIPEARIEAEVVRLEAAVAQAEREIDELHAALGGGDGDAGGGPGPGQPEHLGLLDAHKMMLRDPMLLGEAQRRIRDERMNAEWAVSGSVQHVGAILERVEDPFFRERGADIHHVGQLLLRSLAGGRSHVPSRGIRKGVIIVAHTLSPGDALTLARRGVGGFVVDTGTSTSHTAIIARSTGVPAVLGVHTATSVVGDGDRIIVDGDEGEVIVHPTAGEELLYKGRAARAARLAEQIEGNRDAPAETVDGHRICLKGNLDFAPDTERLLDSGAEGIGLFRTEFLFLGRSTLPDEEEQLAVYRDVLQRAAPHPVTIRTVDVGGDKILPASRLGRSVSPGLRAVRYCLQDQELFRSQLRALFRASAYGDLRMLVPFVSEMSEVLRTRQFMTGVRRELEAEGHFVAPDVPLGFMIEVPAAALIADQIADHADFLAVGTNDLIQYTLAIARDDQQLAYLNHPLHPALLRLMQMVTRAGQASRRPVSICGEMAGDPRYAVVLLALGFDELSMNAQSVPLVKEVIRRTSRAEALRLLTRVLKLAEAAEIADVVDSFMVTGYPDIVTPRRRHAPQHL